MEGSQLLGVAVRSSQVFGVLVLVWGLAHIVFRRQLRRFWEHLGSDLSNPFNRAIMVVGPPVLIVFGLVLVLGWWP